ncbi:hypothetical protein NL676_000100 [Syzygium grande]|nr:hypothetical protein NL676_000100 [Syzygium grande]
MRGDRRSARAQIQLAGDEKKSRTTRRRMEGFTRKQRGVAHGGGAGEAISPDDSDREVRESSRTARRNRRSECRGKRGRRRIEFVGLGQAGMNGGCLSSALGARRTNGSCLFRVDLFWAGSDRSKTSLSLVFTITQTS